MFSRQFKDYTNHGYERRKKMFSETEVKIEEGLKKCKEEEAQLLKFFYASMPLSDVFQYPFSLFLAYAKHAVFLRNHIEWCRELPEEIFVHFVAFYRINTEKIVDCRNLFYESLIEEVKDLSLEKAILETNYWCASYACYESTDERTQSPLSVFQSGSGRCGEESTFVVSVLRSIGIPARQIYTPKWAHCDDNHGWTEVYLEGKWHFIGACEPEEVLNRGWFTRAVSRAILVYTRTFSDYRLEEKEELIGRQGTVFYYNLTAFYTEVKEVVIRVEDETNHPAAGAEISFKVLNMAEMASIMNLYANERGEVRLRIGRGDIFLHALLNERQAFGILRAQEKTACLVLSGRQSEEKWQKAQIEAPASGCVREAQLTARQKDIGKRRRQESEKKRQERKGSNPANIQLKHFLEKDNKTEDRKDLVKSLSDKDYRDAEQIVLEEHLLWAEKWKEKIEDRELYVKYCLCPRIGLEELQPYRETILELFGEKEEAFRQNPDSIWEYLTDKIRWYPKEDYDALITSPAQALIGQYASPKSFSILFCGVCRTFGIPARVNPVTGEAEYFKDSRFIQPGVTPKEEERAKIFLTAVDGEQWVYGQSWTLEKWKNGKTSVRNLEGISFEDGQLLMQEEPGNYRLTMSQRLPNGSQHAAWIDFTLKPREIKRLFLPEFDFQISDLLVNYEVPEYPFRTEDGKKLSLRELCNGETTFLLFIEEGAEPTEHVFHELLERQTRCKEIKMVFVAEKKEALEHETVKKVREAYPDIMFCFDDNQENIEPIARSMYLDPAQLPFLLAVIDGRTVIYAGCGYQVGSVGLVFKILERDI